MAKKLTPEIKKLIKDINVLAMEGYANSSMEWATSCAYFAACITSKYDLDVVEVGKYVNELLDSDEFSKLKDEACRKAQEEDEEEYKS